VRQRFEQSATAVLVLCALITTGLVVRREVFGSRTAPQGAATQQPRYIASWKAVDAIGTRTGPTNAPVTIVEFVDYECPACRRYNEVLADVEKAYPNQVSTIFVHFPLASIHRFAKAAGRSVECAARENRFSEMKDLLFAKQESLGLKPWSEYAREAGVSNDSAFAWCLRDPSSLDKVLAGAKLAEQLKLPSTPSIMVNGWLYGASPAPGELRTAIERILKGKAVVDSAAPGGSAKSDDL
jgi:protein-disulfide isomerase